MSVKYFEWDPIKNELLRSEREVCFEDVLVAVEEGGLLDIVVHPSKEKYPNQKILVVKLQDYVYIVPYVEDDKKYFLKTVIPSREMTKRYIIDKRKK